MREPRHLLVLAAALTLFVMPAYAQNPSTTPDPANPAAATPEPPLVPAETSGQAAPAATAEPAPAPAQAAPAQAMPAQAVPSQAAPHAMAAPEPGFKRTPSPADAYVYIGWPNDGEVLHTTHIKVWFGARNIGVAPAGTMKPNTGHHHLLIDTPLPPMDQPIPNDKNHLHFGLGQTETVIDLPPGTHTLQLLMADGDHIPHEPPLMSRKITIHVVAPATPVAEAH